MKPPFLGGIQLEKTLVIQRPVAEVYRFWRDFENLSSFLNHIKSVTLGPDGRSHWVAEAPAGTTVEWDAGIINDIPNELISWRSLENSQIDNAGSVHFRPAPGGGTEVKIALTYNPPAGPIGEAFALLFAEEPAQQMEADLSELKHLMESTS